MKAITHVGLTVPNIEQAMDWYNKNFGFEAIDEINDTDDNPMLLEQVQGFYSSDVKRLKLVHMTSKSQTGLELFEIWGPEGKAMKKTSKEVWEPGFFHMCIVVDNVDIKVKELEENGAKLRGSIHHNFPSSPYTLAYMEDPFGNLIELITHSTEQVFSNQ